MGHQQERSMLEVIELDAAAGCTFRQNVVPQISGYL